MASRSSRMLAGLAAVAAFAPGVAFAAGPTLLETSVRAGWSASKTQIAARYADPIDPLSSASLTDRNGAPAAGSSSVSGPVLTFTTASPMSGALAPYTITYHAVDPLGGTSVDAEQFGIDAGLPTVTRSEPEESLATPPIPGVERQSVSLPPGPSPTVTGEARDAVGPAPGFSHAETSGVQSVELEFRGISVPLQPATIVTVNQSCGNVCPDTLAFSVPTDLAPGVWNLRVIPVDLAGNRGVSSPQVTFVVIP